ncbi:MAG: phosphotransferase [Pseudomonadota bacterium]
MTDEARQKASSLPIWKGAVEPVALSGGITNVNFKVVDGGEAFVVRIGGNIPQHGIRRTAEIGCARAAHAAGVAPEVVYTEKGVIVTRFVDGKTYGEEDVRDQANLERLLPIIKRLHRETPRYLRGRAPLFWVFHTLRDYFGRMEDEDHRLLGDVPRYRAIADELETAVDRVKLIFGHNDLLAANFIDDGERIWIIDWEYAGFNSALFDLGGLASNNQLSVGQERWLLEEYYETPLGDRQWYRYGAMKCASLLREAVWSMIQEHHSSLDMDYVAYTAENLARFERAYDEWRETT